LKQPCAITLQLFVTPTTLCHAQQSCANLSQAQAARAKTLRKSSYNLIPLLTLLYNFVKCATCIFPFLQQMNEENYSFCNRKEIKAIKSSKNQTKVFKKEVPIFQNSLLVYKD